MSPVTPKTIKRGILPIIEDRMKVEPVIILEGPRSVGKSTILAEIAKKNKMEVLDLDDSQFRDAFNRDIQHFIPKSGLVLIDEYQKANELLSYIKSEFNKKTTPGRYILTGSLRNEALPSGMEKLTGRVHRIVVNPFTQREIESRKENLIDKVFQDPEFLVSRVPSKTSREDYVERILRGGMPLAYERFDAKSRNRWFADYLHRTLQQDVREISKIRQVEMLPRLLNKLAAQSGQILNITKASQSLNLEKSTGENYAKLLESVFLIKRLPAWGTTLQSRITTTPKLHINDSGLLGYLLRFSQAKLKTKDATTQTEFGHVLETFAYGEISRQVELSDEVHLFGHWRTRDDVEVDLVIENTSGEVIAFEIKAAAGTDKTDFVGLRKLRAAVGSQFIGGYVLNLGPRSYTYEDRLHCISLDRLWKS